jgi:Peptidase family M28
MKGTFKTLAALALLAVFAPAGHVRAQDGIVPPAVKAAAARISAEQLKTDLEFFASDDLKGRNTPSPGFDAAAEYIETRLRRAGVKPLGDGGNYRQHYVMRETTLTAADASLAIGQRSFRFGDDFTVRTFAGELIAGPVAAVYVGHGWTADGIDPYRGVDVKGKVVVVHAQSARPKGAAIRQLGRVTLGGTPPLVEAQRRGAIAVVYLASSDPQRPGGSGSQPVVRRELEPGVPSAYAAPLLTSIQLTEQATQALLQGTTLDPARLEEQTKSQTYASTFELPTMVTLRLPATSVLHRPYNVIGLIEGIDPALRNEYILVESHLDGAVGTRTVDGDAIYNSADDNATGSAANLSIAEQMTAVRPRRSLIFLWDSGEEQGLWGTRYFVSRPPVPLANIVAMINIDMIGANRAAGSADSKEDRVTGPDEVFLIGPGVLSDAANSLVDRVNGEYSKLSFNRKYDTPDSEFFYPRTDAGPFLERDVLTIGFTTGLHTRYHLPADEARFLDPAKMAAIARTVLAVVHALGQTDERPRIEKPIPSTVLRVK